MVEAFSGLYVCTKINDSRLESRLLKPESWYGDSNTKPPILNLDIMTEMEKKIWNYTRRKHQNNKFGKSKEIPVTKTLARVTALLWIRVSFGDVWWEMLRWWEGGLLMCDERRLGDVWWEGGLVTSHPTIAQHIIVHCAAHTTDHCALH